MNFSQLVPGQLTTMNLSSGDIMKRRMMRELMMISGENRKIAFCWWWQIQRQNWDPGSLLVLLWTSLQVLSCVVIKRIVKVRMMRRMTIEDDPDSEQMMQGDYFEIAFWWWGHRLWFHPQPRPNGRAIENVIVDDHDGEKTMQGVRYILKLHFVDGKTDFNQSPFAAFVQMGR